MIKGLRQFLGIEGAKLLVETDSPSYRQAGEVSGSLLIKGGKYKQICRSITMELQEFWDEVLGSESLARPVSKFSGMTPGYDKVVKTHKKLQLADQTTIMPYSESSYRFKLNLPLNSRLSTQVPLENEDGVGIEAPLIYPQSGWRLKVYLDIPFAVDPWRFIELKIEPASSFLTIIEIMESEMLFEELISYRTRDSQTGEICFTLIPPSDLKPKLERLSIKLIQTEKNGVAGSVIFELPTRSITESLKRFRLTSDQIYMANSTPNVEEIQKQLRKIINDITISN